MCAESDTYGDYQTVRYIGISNCFAWQLAKANALAGGRLSKAPRVTSKRLEEDIYAKLKYDTTAEQDGVIIGRVMELAAKHGVSMTEFSLAWLLSKVKAVDLILFFFRRNPKFALNKEIKYIIPK